MFESILDSGGDGAAKPRRSHAIRELKSFVEIVDVFRAGTDPRKSGFKIIFLSAFSVAHGASAV